MNAPATFDPRSLPLQRVSPALQAIDATRLTRQRIAQRFVQPRAWVPEPSAARRVPRSALSPAAVLVGLVDGEQGLEVILTERTQQLSSHAGQIAFPGGKVDAQDASLAHAALREAHEEVGLPPQQVQVLGQLPEHTTSTGYAITPVVGLVAAPWVGQPNPQEVSACFTVPLAFLMNPRHHFTQSIDWEGRRHTWYAMPWRALDERSQWVDRHIWGATAAMLRNLYHFLRADD